MSEPKRLRDCQGFVETINGLCSCGGGDPESGCDACKIFHAIGDWLTVAQKPAPVEPPCDACGGTGTINDYVEFGSTSVVMPVGCTVCNGYMNKRNEPAPVEPVEKRCGTCAWSMPIPNRSTIVACVAPAPSCFDDFDRNEDRLQMLESDLPECPCWKAKP